MIDIHHHILPDLEDGSRHMEESLAIAKSAVHHGIGTIIAAPRSIKGELSHPSQRIVEKVRLLNERLKSENVPLTIIPGQQTRIHEEMLENNEVDQLLTLNGGSNYILVDLPSTKLPDNMWELIFNLQLKHFVPIIVQPELNPSILENPDALYRQVKNGALVQVGVDSLLGKNGGKVKRFANQLIEANLVHLVASGKHTGKDKSFSLKEAFKKMEKIHGREKKEYLVENMELVLMGENILALEPERIQTKSFFGFYNVGKKVTR